MDSPPLVSVICLCFNHADYVQQAIQSVWDQEYPNIELIVVDDASSDGSVEKIKAKLRGTSTNFIALKVNQGNCHSFNQGFFQSKGDYLIDLAADDLLLPTRISEGVAAFQQQDIGVHFCDTYFIDPDGRQLGEHYQRNEEGQLQEKVPEGRVYEELIKRYFISAPTMMMKRAVLEALGGYDETLSYEDFDFWIRSARTQRYGFTDRLLVKKRVLPHSLSKKQFRFRSRHQRSTLSVCKKIYALNRNAVEDKALIGRCLYETRQCLKMLNLEYIPSFLLLALKAKWRKNYRKQQEDSAT
ncbi:MAG: glycosyltransferase [Bacteroidota bacterium]